MEARFWRVARRSAIVAALFLTWIASATSAPAAGYRTANFTVAAPSAQLARDVGEAAEHWRRELALEWLGAELPRWAKPCPIKVKLARGAGGATSFIFDRGEVFGWRMDIQGTPERLLDSVVPHEVMHTIFASHFRQPLPRWADEGACTTVEHQSEIAKQEQLLIRFLTSGDGIPFSALFAMKEYPKKVLPLYAQGHSLAKFLIDQQGKQVFLEFVGDGMKDDDWPRAVRQHYGYEHLLALQNSWLDWVRQGRPELGSSRTLVASANDRQSQPGPATRGERLDTSPATTVVRGQNPQASPATIARADSAPAAVATAASIYRRQGPVTPTPSAGEVDWPAQQAAAPAGRTRGVRPNVYDASLEGTVLRR